MALRLPIARQSQKTSESFPRIKAPVENGKRAGGETGFTVLLFAQHVANFPSHRLSRVGLAQKFDAFIEPATMDNGVLRIP
jgi:hypothetical protein